MHQLFFSSFFHLSNQLAACSDFFSLTSPRELQGTNCHARWVLMGAKAGGLGAACEEYAVSENVNRHARKSQSPQVYLSYFF
jgi:hypothetical protein